MLRARSSLLLAHLVTWWFFLSGLVFVYTVVTPNTRSQDSWRENLALVANLERWSIVFTFITGIAALALVTMEICLYRGWEPRFLEVLKPGCEILKMTAALDRSKATVMVRLVNGTIETFEADPEEMIEIQVGSVSHLWVIGKYISRIRLINPLVNPVPVSQADRMAILPHAISLRTAIFLGFFLVGASYASGVGLLMAITREAQYTVSARRGYSNSSAYTEHFQGGWVPLAGVGLMVLGIALIFVLYFAFKIGWDDVALEAERDDQFDQRVRRGWW